MFVADLHNDVLQRAMNGEDISKQTENGHSDLIRLKDSCIDLEVFVVWIDRNHSKEGTFNRANKLYDILEALERENKFFKITKTISDIYAAKNNNILAAPISTLETVLAFVGAGATKTLIVGAVIYATASFFAEVTVKYPMLMIFLLILVSFTFALFGFLIGVVSKNFEQMSIIPSLVITPMVFLGGSLYSLDMLPPFWQTVSYFNPVVYLIDGLRFSFYGISDFNIWISVGSMVSFLVICVIAVSILLKKGYNIKS